MGRPIHIENDRLEIHGLKDRDLEALSAMRNDPVIYRYEPAFLEELLGSAEEALQKIRSMDLREDRQCILGIYEKTDPDTLAGLAELYDYKPSGKVISIGLRFRPEYWGRGMASSCVSALLDFIRNETQVELVTAHVLPGNKASAGCVRKNGFEYLLSKEEDWGLGEPSVAEVYTYDC